MSFLQTFKVSVSGMLAQRKRMDVIAQNLANIETTKTSAGGPYRRKMVVIGTKPTENFNDTLNTQLQGSQVEKVVEDPTPFKQVFNPAHPDADENGYLQKPNVDLVVEVTNMLMARRSFEANVSAVKTTRQMALKALEIGK
jgi:flagellar basal-body rod protein FlgC